MKIQALDAYQVFDSRGNPTIEVEVILEGGFRGRAIVPSGASKGSHEAWELRDNDEGRFGGKSVYIAVELIRTEIAKLLVGRDALCQDSIDAAMIELDGTPNRSRLGANSMLAASMACCVAAANSQSQPLFAYLGKNEGNLLPLPEIQIVGGGAHAAHRIDIQDFMIVALRAQRLEQSLEITSDVYHRVAKVLHERNIFVGVADEGGYWPMVESNEEVFEILLTAISQAGYVPGIDVAISLDIAATELLYEGNYHFRSERRTFSSDEFIDLICCWVRNYPIISIEDPLAENDWRGWQRITAELGDQIQIVGDDLFTTNVCRINRGIAETAANAVLIKPNQVGTVTETIAAIRQTQEAGWLPIISARSGETEDTFIAHLAVAFNAGQIKVGSFSRSERMAKWNELLRIERALGTKGRFVGARGFHAR